MLSFKIFLLVFLTLFITLSYGQTEPTLSPTTAPTICKCDTYTGNSSYILDSNNGCKSSFDGYDICEDCFANECECVSEQYDTWCKLRNDIADALATWIIILIVIGSVCGLCIIACIIYCICAGALCCAAASKGTASIGGGTQMV